MSSYLEPILNAVWFFPFVAVLFTFPYMVWQYRRYGSVLVLRTIFVYSFILYLMCAYFLTILPLPSIESVAMLTTPTIQLVPFTDLMDFINNSGLVLTQPSTYVTAFTGHRFVEISMNVLMLVPFGVYMRYYFRCSAWQTVLLALCVSLVFELTQLSGLFFIYPRPYRLCDVDDLITNTFGGWLGYLIAPLFMKALPTAERLDEVSYRRGLHVSIIRRLACLAVDWFVVLVAYVLLLLSVSWIGLPIEALPTALQYLPMLLAFLVLVYLYFGVLQWLCGGRTLGKSIFRIKLCARGGGKPRLWQCLVRTMVLQGGLLLTPVFSLIMIFGGGNGITAGELIAFAAINGAVLVLFAISAIRHVADHTRPLVHDWLAHTRLMSTNAVTPEMLIDAGIDPFQMSDVAAPDAPREEKTVYLN